jgi:N-acetylmuramoyl-L-alanine amidase
VGNGKLAGKLIVVDPGHGGKDRGANSNGVFEKDLNLKIGRLVAEELAKAGATVIMTRKTDVFISLNERALIAERNKADLFVSCHINSTGGSGSQSGGITFHHLGRPVSRLLAECIQDELAKIGGIPDRGVWSDGKIYRSGFAVLRQTTMPGVLLELGFINHSRDRARLVQEDFQRGVAAAVVRGIKVFLGDAKKND